MVVKDTRKVASRLARAFGSTWTIYDFKPTKIVLNGRPRTGDCALKIAVGNCGGYAFKLIQPVSGESSYMDFLRTQGEGFYSVGLGILAMPPNPNAIVDAFTKDGIGIEMQGDIGDGSKFTVLRTADALGCRIEFSSCPTRVSSANLRRIGTVEPSKTTTIDMDYPITSGGRRFDEIGIVVKDERVAAQRFEELLGIRNWYFFENRVHPTTEFLYDMSVENLDEVSAGIGGAVANFGGAQFELLAPGELKPGGSHRVFLDKHGHGIQFLRINSVGNDEAEIAALLSAGFLKSREATFYPTGVRSGPHSVSTFLSMEEDLGGFVLQYFTSKES